jgi:hypothetical protein
MLAQLGFSERLYQDAEVPASPKADLVSGHANNARVAGPKHADGRSATKTELFEAVDMVGRADDTANPSVLAGRQTFERDGAIQHGSVFRDGKRRRRPKRHKHGLRIILTISL